MGLRSALIQEAVDLEVLVVDDGSSDDTSSRLRAFPDARVRVITLPRWSGLAHARNCGIGEARGKWIAFLDDDDAWAPTKLKIQLDALSLSGGDFAYTSVVVIDERMAPLRHVPAPDAQTLLESLLIRNVLASASNVIARAALVREVGAFDEELFHLSDWDLWIRLAQSGMPVALDDTLVGWLYHANNLTLFDRDATPEFVRITKKYPTMSGGQRAAGIAGRRWRAHALRRAGRRFAAAREYLKSAVQYQSAGDLARAVGAVAGEDAIKLATGSAAPTPVAPAWLRLYR
jgi:glycosyltransferase involved in cell wall biosynthesis